jgi:ribulose-phosphate 3-epimerase
VTSWAQGAKLIRQSGNSPGAVLTVNEKMKLHLFLRKIKDAGIHNILVMGVPVGRGGQSFKFETIERIRNIRKWADQNEFKINIEVDGGLSDAVIPDCINAGALFLSGWSMFLKYGIGKIEKRINELLNG